MVSCSPACTTGQWIDTFRVLGQWAAANLNETLDASGEDGGRSHAGSFLVSGSGLCGLRGIDRHIPLSPGSPDYFPGACCAATLRKHLYRRGQTSHARASF